MPKHKKPIITVERFLFIFILILLIMIGSFSLMYLKKENSNLQNEIEQTSNEKEELNQKYNSLNSQYSTLKTTNKNLKDEISAKEDEILQLELRLDDALEPPYISIADQTVHLKFKNRYPGFTTTILGSSGLEFESEQIIEWTLPFTSLEASVYNGNYKRAFDLNEERIKLDGEIYVIPNVVEFVDEGPFEDVMQEASAEISDDEMLIQYIWAIVEQMSVYTSDIGEQPKYPLETLLSGGGDCEDTAILMASLLKAVPRNWDVSLVAMDIDNPTDPQEVNHVIVKVETKEQNYLIETTAQGDMFTYDEVVGWFFET